LETKEFKGIIEYDDDDGARIYLHDGDDKIDLVSEFEDFDSKEIQVNYWITEKTCTKDELLEWWLKKVFGAVEAEYEDHYIGSWTYGSQSSWGEHEYRGILKIGGHDLFDELSDMNGKFLIMEINIK